MAIVHVLRGQERVFGFTLDEQGTNLPLQYGPWTAFKTIELHHDEPYQGVDVSVCLDDISQYGFHLTAAHKRITDLALRCVAGRSRANERWSLAVAERQAMPGRSASSPACSMPGWM
jgi:hypothetical protein